MVIAVDVDGVVADMFPVWLARYHADYPEAPYALSDVYGERAARDEHLLAYLNDATLYDDVQPVDNALPAIQALRGVGHRVVFVTSCVKGMVDGKWSWLQRNGFLPVGEMQSDDLIVVHDKSMIRADALIDDLPRNVAPWGACGILFAQPWNDGADAALVADDWLDVLSHLARIQTVKASTTTATRVFATGATRDANSNKLAFEGFIDPIVLRRFAEFMHSKRTANVPAGQTLRDPDNWQKGIPNDAYADSGVRHAMEWWSQHRGYEVRDEKGTVMDLEEVLCALLFNDMGYLRNLLRARGYCSVGAAA